MSCRGRPPPQKHRGPAAGQQVFYRGSSPQPGEWNKYEIEVAGDAYTVRLNGFETATFTNTATVRGVPVGQNTSLGFVGVQSHTGQVLFRAIRIKAV